MNLTQGYTAHLQYFQILHILRYTWQSTPSSTKLHTFLQLLLNFHQLTLIWEVLTILGYLSSPQYILLLIAKFEKTSHIDRKDGKEMIYTVTPHHIMHRTMTDNIQNTTGCRTNKRRPVPPSHRRQQSGVPVTHSEAESKYLGGWALVGVLGDPSFGVGGSVLAITLLPAGDWLLVVVVIVHILRVFIAVIQGLLIDILQHPKHLQIWCVTICWVF